MRASLRGLVFPELDRLLRHGAGPRTDRNLLDGFVAGGDGAAFEALVARHGPMVLGVCRRLLVDPHDADDAFQATFLVLMRKAGRLRDPDRLGPWLYGVASRVATKARMRAARRRDRSGIATGDRPVLDPSTDLADVRPVLDAELGRLPRHLREVLVLCLLEGDSAEEAARRLACPVGTVKSRLARGREALRLRLTRRGVVPAVAVAAVSSSSSFASTVPAALIRASRCAALGPTSAVAPGVAELMRGAATMSLPKSALAASLVLASLTSGLGLMTLTRPVAVARAQDPAPAPQPDANLDAMQRARLGTVNNLKQVMLAFHNYADANGAFPAAAIHSADGKPLLSWRVALLPYLDATELYNQFHLDEPWDSPHNKPLAGKMPDIFRTPGYAAPHGKTRLRVFTGEGAVFDGKEGRRLSDIHDGTSNTMVVGVAREAAEWTRPGDLPFVEWQPMPNALDDSDPRGYAVGLADGSVLFVRKAPPDLLRALITRAGGEVMDGVAQPATRPAPGVAVVESAPGQRRAVRLQPGMPPAVPLPPGRMAPDAPLPPALEARLQRLEDKLDRVLRALEGKAEGAEANRPAGASGP